MTSREISLALPLAVALLTAETVFKVTLTGVEMVLHAFSGGPDGFSPQASLVLDANGHLYGTTIYGGAFGAGTLFKVVP